MALVDLSHGYFVIRFHQEEDMMDEGLALTDQLNLGSAIIKVETSLSTGCLGPLAQRPKTCMRNKIFS